MKHKGIIQPTESVRAILDGRKTLDIVPVKPQPFLSDSNIWKWKNYIHAQDDFRAKMMECAPYKSGQVLYVKEKFFHGYPEYSDPEIESNWEYWYFADTRDERPGDVSDDWCVNEFGFDKKLWPHWSPSIHMPEAAARIWLKVTGIEPKRLADVTQEEARCMGGLTAPHRPDGLLIDNEGGYVGCPLFEKFTVSDCYYCAFKNEFLKKYGSKFGGNPWVWVIKYEVLSATGKPENI